MPPAIGSLLPVHGPDLAHRHTELRPPASVFCACSKSRFRAVLSLPLCRFASVTNLRRSCCSERVAAPVSRPPCLRRSLIAFWAASSDRLSWLTAVGSLKDFLD